MRFKVGDWVHLGYTNNADWVGDIGIVTGINNNLKRSIYIYRVRSLSGAFEYGVEPLAMKKVNKFFKRLNRIGK